MSNRFILLLVILFSVAIFFGGEFTAVEEVLAYDPSIDSLEKYEKALVIGKLKVAGFILITSWIVLSITRMLFLKIRQVF